MFLSPVLTLQSESLHGCRRECRRVGSDSSGTRPIMALSLALLFGVLAVQILVPVEPRTPGPIMAVVGQDLTPGEWLLFVDATVPSDAQLDELNLLEPVELVP